MHIVGLFIDENDTELAEKLDELKMQEKCVTKST